MMDKNNCIVVYYGSGNEGINSKYQKFGSGSKLKSMIKFIGGEKGGYLTERNDNSSTPQDDSTTVIYCDKIPDGQYVYNKPLFIKRNSFTFWHVIGFIGFLCILIHAIFNYLSLLKNNSINCYCDC